MWNVVAINPKAKLGFTGHPELPLFDTHREQVVGPFKHYLKAEEVAISLIMSTLSYERVEIRPIARRGK